MGLLCALAPFGITVWTPAALYGPRGVVGNPGPLPAVLHRLARLAGQPLDRAQIDGGIATLHTAQATIRANLTDQPQQGLPPFGID